jgi:selenocysteine lyase/cysteine desulfurase
LLGPYSTGFFYLTPAVQARLHLPFVNWLTVEGSEDFDHLPIEQFKLSKTAKVFDVPATANFLNLHGLDASLEYVQGAGVRTVREHCTRLLERLTEGLERRRLRLSAAARPQCRSTILCFQAQSLDETRRLFDNLQAQEVAVSLRQGMIRVSPYLYNDEADIDKLWSVMIGNWCRGPQIGLPARPGPEVR